MKTEWTPGPWSAYVDSDEDGQIHSVGAMLKHGYRKDVCKIYGWGADFESDTEQQSNARLIAAAPELAGLLRAALEYHDDLSCKDIGGKDEWPGWAKKARAILAKLEG